jgi:hypothetical protein
VCNVGVGWGGEGVHDSGRIGKPAASADHAVRLNGPTTACQPSVALTHTPCHITSPLPPRCPCVAVTWTMPKLHSLHTPCLLLTSQLHVTPPPSQVSLWGYNLDNAEDTILARSNGAPLRLLLRALKLAMSAAMGLHPCAVCGPVGKVPSLHISALRLLLIDHCHPWPLNSAPAGVYVEVERAGLEADPAWRGMQVRCALLCCAALCCAALCCTALCSAACSVGPHGCTASTPL